MRSAQTQVSGATDISQGQLGLGDTLDRGSGEHTQDVRLEMGDNLSPVLMGAGALYSGLS